MAHSVSAKKRIRQNETHRARNRWRLRTMRIAIREFLEHAQHGSDKDTQASFRKACQLIDKTASKGVIHKNTAARRKSRLAKRLKAAGKPA